MFLDYWMLVIMGIWWLASTYYISRTSRIEGITMGLNYAIDVLDYEGSEKKEAIDRIRKSLN